MKAINRNLFIGIMIAAVAAPLCVGCGGGSEPEQLKQGETMAPKHSKPAGTKMPGKTMVGAGGGSNPKLGNLGDKM